MDPRDRPSFQESDNRPVPSRPRPWDRVRAVISALAAARSNGVIAISYNALDFFLRDYAVPDLPTLRQWVEGAAELATSTTVTLDCAIKQWRDPATTLENASRFCNTVPRLTRWMTVRHAKIAGHSPFVVASARLIAGAPIDDQLDSDLREFIADSRPEWREVLRRGSLGVDEQFRKHGSTEIVRFLREVSYQDPDQRQRFWQVVIGNPPKAFEEWDVSPTLPELLEPIFWKRRISFALPGLDATWLSNSADAKLEGMEVDFECGDSILFDLRKMLANPRGAVGSGTARLRTGVGMHRDVQHAQWNEISVEDSRAKQGEAQASPAARFNAPAGTKWEEIEIKIIMASKLQIIHGRTKKSVTYAEMGFEDKRRGGMPDTRWKVLLLLAQNPGPLRVDQLTAGKRRCLENAISEIRKRLKAVVGIPDDPFLPFKQAGGYLPRFRLEDTQKRTKNAETPSDDNFETMESALTDTQRHDHKVRRPPPDKEEDD